MALSGVFAAVFALIFALFFAAFFAIFLPYTRVLPARAYLSH